MFCDTLNSILIHSHIIGYILSTLLGVLVGGYATYRFDEKRNKNIAKDKAFIAAILIRFWLIELISQLTDLDIKLRNRLALIPKVLNDLEVMNTQENDEMRKREISSVCDKFDLTENPFYLDHTLIKDLCSQHKKYSKELEIILQDLSTSENLYRKGIRAKSIFNDFKYGALVLNRESSQMVKTDLKAFLNSLKSDTFIPTWLKLISDSQKQIEGVFEKFQEHVCKPLGIKQIRLGGPVKTTDLIKEDTSYYT